MRTEENPPLYFKYMKDIYEAQSNVSNINVFIFLCIPLQVKCDQYWPGRGTETYGLIQVSLLDTVELATYTVRTFALYKVTKEGDHVSICNSEGGPPPQRFASPVRCVI